MTVARRRTGAIAEDLVASRLAAAGWEIVERNARTRYGELDIVARDGRTLVFIEVKAAREGTQFGPERPILSIDSRKQQRVRRLATAWMAKRRDQPPYEEIRFDAVGVILDHAGRATAVDYVKSAF
jgi:putative endonuclease